MGIRGAKPPKCQSPKSARFLAWGYNPLILTNCQMQWCLAASTRSPMNSCSSMRTALHGANLFSVHSRGCVFAHKPVCAKLQNFTPPPTWREAETAKLFFLASSLGTCSSTGHPSRIFRIVWKVNRLKQHPGQTHLPME